MGRHATPIRLTAEEQAELERRVGALTSRQQEALRAQIKLRAADHIAAALSCSRHRCLGDPVRRGCQVCHPGHEHRPLGPLHHQGPGRAQPG